MNWFVWRQHRKQFLVFGVILAVFTVAIILTGNHFWHSYQHAVTVCQQNPETPSCNDLSGSIFQGGDGAIMNAVFVTGLIIPLILGLFLGAPLFSKEYEEGTNKLAWTQSVSRRRWLSVKLLWVLSFAALYGLVIGLLITWWTRPINALNQNRFDTGFFDVQGMMPFAFSLFFTAIGLTMSAWFRKTIVALAVTLGLFIALQVSFGQWIRPHYMTPVSVTAPIELGAIENKIPTGAWVLTRGDLVNKSGQEESFDVPNFPPACQKLTLDIQVPDGSVIAKQKATGIDPVNACLNQAGYHQLAKFQPSYRYWDFQRIETGIYLGMTAIAVTATYYLVLRRDA